MKLDILQVLRDDTFYAAQARLNSEWSPQAAQKALQESQRVQSIIYNLLDRILHERPKSCDDYKMWHEELVHLADGISVNGSHH